MRERFFPMRGTLWRMGFAFAFLASAPLGASALASDADPGSTGYFFYSGGKRIPLKLDTNSVAVKLRGTPSSELALDAARRAGLAVREAKPHGPASEGLVRLDLPAAAGETRLRDALKRLEALPDVDMAAPRFLDEAGRPMTLTGKIAVGLAPGIDRGWLERKAAELGAEVDAEVIPGARAFALRLPPRSGKNALDVSNALYGLPEVRFSHPDFVVRRILRSEPSDPLFPMQWHLDNTGQDGAQAGADVRALGAWAITMGSPDIRIAVIDEGMDMSHEDFVEKLVDPWDFVDGDANPSEDVTGGHGTSVAGVAAALADNGKGGTGIAPAVKIIPIRLLGPNGETTLLQEADAFRWAADHGADVINNSWGPDDDGGSTPLPDIVREGIDYAADLGRGGKGCVIFFAAGNGNELVSNDGYASYEKVLAVAASTDQDLRAGYSDYGPEIAVAAPSNGGKTTGIWTTDVTGRLGYNPGKIPAGHYYIGVALGEGLSSGYTLKVGEGGPLVSEQEPNDTLAEAQPIPFPATVNGLKGLLDTGGFVDQNGIRYTDLYAVDLPGDDVKIRLDILGSADLDLGLIAEDGYALAFRDKPGTQAEEIHTGSPPGDDSGSYTSRFGGTSSGSPLAAGVAALILSVAPDLSRDEVRTILEETADKIDSAGGAYDASGHSAYYGYGRVNAEKALLRATQIVEPPPPAKHGGGGGGCAIGGGREGASGWVLGLLPAAVAVALRWRRRHRLSGGEDGLHRPRGRARSAHESQAGARGGAR